MKSVVVYESMYGNTHTIADAIGRALAPFGPVVIATPEQLSPEAVAEADLVVVGGPTHVHGMASSKSREAAVEAAEADPDLDIDADLHGPVLREWFRQLPMTTGRLAAAFDTRLDKPAMLTGSAAKGIAKRLRKHGFELIADPESYFVVDGEGPLAVGETDRAGAWAAGLGESCVVRADVSS